MDETEKARLSLGIANWLAPFSVAGVGFPLPTMENLVQAFTPGTPLSQEERAAKALACVEALVSRGLVKRGLFADNYVAASSRVFAPSTSDNPWAWEET